MPDGKFQSLADFLAVPDPSLPEPLPVITEPPDVDLAVKDFAQNVLNSREYRASLMRRVVMDSLPPALEILLYHYAHGKPVEKYEHGGKDGGPIPLEIIRRIVDPALEGGQA